MPSTAKVGLHEIGSVGKGASRTEPDWWITPKHVWLGIRVSGGKPEKKVNICRTYDRFDFLEATRDGKGRIGVEDVRKRLDVVNLGELTLQTMVFEPATLKLGLAIGSPPASSLPLRALDLAPLLKPSHRVGQRTHD